MVITVKKMSLGWGLGGLVVSVCALGQNACSSNSAAPSGGDASAPDAMVVGDEPMPALGEPVSSCAGCETCAGVLTSPDSGTSYCTKACTTSTDCPMGTGCVPSTTSAMLLDMQCLKICTSDTDCTAPFICRSDLPTAGKFCFSQWPPLSSGTGSDAGKPAAVDAGAPETGASVDSGAPSEAGTPEAGQPEAAAPDGGDAGDGG